MGIVILLSLFSIYSILKNYLSTRQQYLALLSQREYQQLDCRKTYLIVYSVFLMFSFLLLGLSFYFKDIIYIALSISIIISVIFGILKTKYDNVYYYSDNGFIVEGHYIRYKNVQKINLNRFSASLKTSKNEEFIISKKFANHLQQYI